MNLSKEVIQKAKKLVASEEFKQGILEGVKPTTNKFKMHIDVDVDFDIEMEGTFEEFTRFCLEHLGIENESSKLTVVLSTEKEAFQTYAFYHIEKKIAAVYCPGRAILDIMRSLAHELVHFKQDMKNEIESEQMGSENDGVPIEDEANAVAGVIMRKFGRIHRELY